MTHSLSATSFGFGRRPTKHLLLGASTIMVSSLGILLLISCGALILNALPVLLRDGSNFVFKADWFFRHDRFGALSMLYGSVVVSSIALALAVPVAIGSAIFVSEYLPSRQRLVIKAIIELLAGIPSVIYGLLGVLLLRDWIFSWLERWDPISGDSLLTAGVLLGVMILPTIMTLTEDALHSVSKHQKFAARGLGLNRAESVLAISLPQAFPGILAAILLGLGRALGEMTAVFLVIGRMDNQLPGRWLDGLQNPGQTLTTKIGGAETFIAMGDPMHSSAILSLGLLLMVLTAVAVIAGSWVSKLTRRQSA